MKNKAIFITVRTDSTRLPNKCLLDINGTTTIEFLIRRIKKSKLVDKIILCTTSRKIDDILCEIAKNNNINFFRGSTEDKLDRWNGACEKFNIDFFVTADGDDLFCDPELIDLAFKQYENNNNIDFIKCDKIICGAFTYGIKYEALKKVCSIKNTTDTEMMWVYFTETKKFHVEELDDVPKQFFRDDIRMTLDYEDDLKFFQTVVKSFNNKDFSLYDIIELIDNTNIAKINFYLHEKWKINQIQKTKLILKTGE